MNTTFEQTFLGWVQTYFDDAMRSDFTQQHSVSLDFLRKMNLQDFISVMIGPFNKRAYSKFHKWLSITEREWTATQRANILKAQNIPKLNPTNPNFIDNMLTRLKEDIYRLYEHNFYPRIRNDSQSGWADDIATFLETPGAIHGFSVDKSHEIVNKLDRYADAMVVIMGTNFFRTFESPEQVKDK